jgi:hypothetical protein
MATALGGLVIIGVLIAGVFFTSNQELRVGTNTFVQERAFRAAEFGINTTLANWSNAALLQLPVGGTTQTVYDSSAKGWRDTVTITRLNATGFLIGSTGTAFGGIQGTSRRRTALLVRLSSPRFKVNGALVSRGGISTSNVPLVTGVDGPLDWSDCPPAEPAAGVVVSDSSQLMLGKTCLAAGNCLLGSPDLLAATDAADTATFFDLGDESWSSLTKYGPKVYTTQSKPPGTVGPVVTSGVCDQTAEGNWGDPTRSISASPCESYFPIIHAQGSGTVRLSGGKGQGILLVEGDLEISKTFEFYGPVIVRGKFESKNSAQVHGTVMAANIQSATNDLSGTSAVSYSSCAIKKAFENAIPPKRVIERAWMEVF